MSLFTELKERRVFRVGGIYLVALFATLQGAQVLVESLSLPAWTMTMLTLAGLFAFPIILVLTWTFDVTPTGVQRVAGAKRRSAYVAFAVVVLLVGAGAYAAYPGRGAGGGKIGEAGVAVLPFVDMSPDKSQEYFGDGIAEEILNTLVRIPGLRVPGRTSSFSFKGNDVPISAIAQQLGVGHVLEGSVRKWGDSVRITAQLINASTDEHVWSEQYDRRLADAFAIQGEIAHAIAEALQLRIRRGTQLGARETENPAAYEHYLKGLHHWRTRVELPQALDAFSAAVRADSAYASAWAGIAMTYAVIAQYTPFDVTVAIREGKLAAERALRLDARNAEAHAALAAIAIEYEYDWATAARQLDRAEELDPKSPWIHIWRGNLLRALGRNQEALEATARSIELDPLNTVARVVRTSILWDLGRRAESIEATRAVLNDDPRRFEVRMMLVARLVLERRFDEAVAHAELPWANEWPDLVRSVQDPARAQNAHRILNAGRGAHGMVWFTIPYYLALGEHDSIAAVLDRAADSYDTALMEFAVRPDVVAVVSNHPRFQSFLRKLNLAAPVSGRE